MFLDHIVTTGAPAVVGTYLAVEDPMTLDWFDRLGFAAVAVMLLWWVLKRFSASMDAQAKAIEDNTEAIRELEQTIREKQ